MRSSLLFAIVLGVGACGWRPFDPPEVAACEAFTKQLLSDPGSYRRTGYRSVDRTVTLDQFSERAGLAGTNADPGGFNRHLLELASEAARLDGRRGELGIRGIILDFKGGGVGRGLPAGENACEFRLVDGALQSSSQLREAVDAATSNHRMAELKAVTGSEILPATDPALPCCLVM